MSKHVTSEHKHSTCRSLIEAGRRSKDFQGRGEGKLNCYLKGVSMDVFEFSEE